MGKFRKKPVVIEAVQLTWKTLGEVCEFLGNIVNSNNPVRETTEFSDTCGEVGGKPEKPWLELTIPTLEGDHIARHGDWIIKGVNGEFYPCKPDIFVKTYEAEV